MQSPPFKNCENEGQQIPKQRSGRVFYVGKKKTKKRRQKEKACVQNRTQDLLRAGPFRYHYATWGQTTLKAIIFYLPPFPQNFRQRALYKVDQAISLHLKNSHRRISSCYVASIFARILRLINQIASRLLLLTLGGFFEFFPQKIRHQHLTFSVAVRLSLARILRQLKPGSDAVLMCRT